MTGSDVVAALDLPSGARVNQRVPKKLLADYRTPTPVDKRRINNGIDEVHWLAAPGTDLGTGPDDEIWQAFVAAISIARQPRLNFYALYHGWLDTVLALRAARLTGVFDAKEKQVARQVQLNLELRRPQAGYAAARSML